MLAPIVSKAWALPSPADPAKTSAEETSSASTKPDCWMASRYSPSRRAPPNQAVEASPGAYIQHGLTSLNCAQGEGIAYPGKGLHGLRRHGIYQFHRVAQ